MTLRRKLEAERLTPLSALLRLLIFLPILGCGGFRENITASTVVAPLPSEDLSGACKYDLLLANSSLLQKGVFVIFERGDSVLLFQDDQVRRAADQIGFSIVFAHECDAKSYPDLQSNASKGPGRALFQALNQFASTTGHSELASAKVILYGFSAAGVLATEMSSFAPQRTLALIAYAAGSAYVDIVAFIPTTAALSVPSLFLANAKDQDAGTYRSYEYFLGGRAVGAAWAFGVQNGIGHCCNVTTKPLVIPWMQAAAEQLSIPSAQIASSEVFGTFTCSSDGTLDAQGDEDCNITSASLASPPSPTPDSAWLPTSNVATQWIAWVSNPGPN